MSVDVVITGSARYGEFVRPSSPTSTVSDYVLRNDWATQVDRSDGRPTTDRAHTGLSRSHGQRLMHAVVPAPEAALLNTPAFGTRVIELTIATYAKAAQWSRGGRLAILVDHGAPGIIALAPGDQLTVNTLEVLRIANLVHGPNRGANLDATARSVVDLGRAMHDGSRRLVREVMLLSCSVGVGADGQIAIDWLARIWGIPVLGMLGDFWIREDARMHLYRSWVAPGGSSATTPPLFGASYTNDLPRDPRLFRRSASRP